MQLSNPAVVAVEEGQKVMGKVVLVIRAQCADDAEVHRQPPRVRRVTHVHENVARVHVGVEEIV